MGVIKIRGLEVCAKHGVFESEKLNPQRFVFDADLTFDFYAAAKRDDLSLTVNYAKACEIISKIATGNAFDLIETLAYSCVYALLDAFPVGSAEVTVYKPQAPVDCKFQTLGVTVKAERQKVLLSLGSSLGDRENYLKTAIAELEKTRGVKVKKVSSVIETQPVGGVAENKFLNCAAEIETYLTPRQLLDEIHLIEAKCGRERKLHWGDRTLDIDIIFFGNRVISEEGLVIPHPEYRKRAFVLTPLKEIAPDFVCPVCREKISDMQFV